MDCQNHLELTFGIVKLVLRFSTADSLLYRQTGLMDLEMCRHCVWIDK